MERMNKITLIEAPLLIDRGAWVRLNENPEPFTLENARAQLAANPLDILNQLSSFRILSKKCNCTDLSKNIEELNKEFLSEVFEKKKQRFWSYIADNCLEKYFKEIEKNIKDALAKNQQFLAIGGSHAIAWPASKAIFNYYSTLRDKISIIYFDDHEDNYGNKMEKIRPAMYHGTWAEIVRRNFNYTPFWIRPENFDSSTLAAELKGKKFLHLSIDIDVFDEKYSLSTFYSRFDKTFGIGTMTTELFADYLKEIKKIADENYVKILGADISEFVPYSYSAEKNKKTAGFIAEILNSLMELIV